MRDHADRPSPVPMSYRLSDGEGTLLSLVERAQPVTVYEISKVYLASPVTQFGTSKGKLYPMVKRLKASGLIEAESIEGDGRKTEHLRLTDAGLSSLREWTGRIDPAHMLLDDPLRTRIQSLHLLEPAERIAWLEGVAEAMRAKLADVERYAQDSEIPLADIVIDNVRAASEARIAWAERTIAALREARTG